MPPYDGVRVAISSMMSAVDVVRPAGAHAGGQVDDDLPVGPRLAGCLHGLAQRCTLRSVFVKVPSFSAKLAAGRTTSASFAVSLRKMSWTTRKSSACRPCSTWVMSGSESIGFSPMTKRALTRPSIMASMVSVTVKPGASGKLGAPGGAQLRPRRLVGDLLVAGVDVGQGADVAGALHVVLAAQRVHAGPGLAEVAGEHGEVADGEHVVGAVRVLGDAHGVDDGGALGRGEQARRLAQLLRGHAGDLLDQLRRVRAPAPRAAPRSPSVRSAMKLSSARPSSTMTCMRPLSRATSVPGRSRRCRCGAARQVDLARVGDDRAPRPCARPA